MAQKMNSTDRRLLSQLLANSRQPLGRLASAARVSKQNVAYRLAKMASRKDINSFITLINSRKIGYVTCCMNFRLRPVSVHKEKQLISALLALGVTELFACEGEWNLLVAITSQSLEGLAKKSLALHNILRGLLLDAEWFMPLSATVMLPFPMASAERGGMPTKIFGEAESVEKIDDIDRRLLSAVSINSRAAYSDIGKSIGVSSETARYRLKSLEKRKIITGYTVSLGTDLEGLHHYRIFLNLGTPTEGNVQEVFKFVSCLSCTRRVVRLLSEFELAYDIRVGSEKEAMDTANAVARRFHKIIHTQVLLRIIKEYRFSYFPPI